MKVLLLEDDEKISALIQNGLTEAECQVECAFDGESGLALAEKNVYDVLILDMMLPKLDGAGVIEKLREAKKNTPILIVSAKISVQDKVSALKLGADDYMTKPFAFDELLARIEALVRRASGSPGATQLNVADITVDLVTREVARAGKSIELQAKEFALLEYFLKNPDKIVPKNMILETIWGYNFDPQTNVVDVLVCRLRNKIDKGFKTKMIQTRRGIGYFFKTN